MNEKLTKESIACILQALGNMLDTAAIRVEEAEDAIRQGEQNQAIGSIIGLEEHLQNALALYRAAIALHRAGRAP
jgi:hypothetical protein